MENTRSPLSIMLSVWKALFLREAVSRISSTRTAWIWLLLDPMIQVVFLVIIFGVIRMRTVGGIDTMIWVASGLLSFNLFRQVGNQTRNAINANQALFTYRQVKPIDTIITRAILEGLIGILVSLFLFAGSFLFEFGIFPAEPLIVFFSLLGMWLIGVGFGLVTSVLTELIPVINKMINILITLLYFSSGVIFPIASVPYPYQEWLIFNPLLHGVEAIRVGFAPYYHAIQGLNIGYLYFFALCNLFLGLILHKRFAKQMIRL